jgi:8-oxo-dGTP pyrophosphatase MutT (NUDIX family)
MKRNHLLSLLAAYHPTNDSEKQSKQTIIDFVTKNPDCFERSLEIGHITASAWLLNKTGNHALLLHHKKLNNWFQLGGHCDGESDVCAVAIKEAQEESGIVNIAAVSPAIFDIDVHAIPENKKEKAHYHYDIRFLLQVTSDETIMHNEESNELRWIGKKRNELPTNEPSVVRMFEKWCALQT